MNLKFWSGKWGERLLPVWKWGSRLGMGVRVILNTKESLVCARNGLKCFTYINPLSFCYISEGEYHERQ